MRYLFLFLLLTSFAFAPSDKDQLEGTWTISEVRSPDGKVVFSTDSVKQQALIDEMVKNQDAMDEQTFRDLMTKNFKKQAQITMTFHKNGTCVVEKPARNPDDKPTSTESTYVMDEDFKTLLMDNGRSPLYTYTFADNDTLLLEGGTNGSMTLVRRK